MCCLLMAGCAGPGVAEPEESGSDATVSAAQTPAGDTGLSPSEETVKSDEEKPAADTDDGESLAQRMSGKYSYHYSGNNGEEEFLIIDVVNYGDNLYAFCGRAMPDDYENFEAYTFWACEFIPYDRSEMASTDGDTVRVNALCFSVMSNAGKYWDSGSTGTVKLTDDGLVFEDFGHDGFFVPYTDDSRLFLKDERVQDVFSYLKDENVSGNDELQGCWKSRDAGGDFYIRFSGKNMYMYEKSPDAEVFFGAGGCDFHGSSFDCTGNMIDTGGMPFEFSADYDVDGDRLFLSAEGEDAPYKLPSGAEYERISEHDVHVTEMDEVIFDEDSFGAFGQMEKEPFYGVWIEAFKDEEDAKALVAELSDKGLPALYVYSCDWENLNAEPYYCVTIGKHGYESDAEEYLDDAAEAGYPSAYVKYTGDCVKSE